MQRNRNRMSNVVSLMLLVMTILGFCVEKASMEVDRGTPPSVIPSVLNTPTMAGSANTPVTSSLTTAKPDASVPPADFSNAEVPPSSTIADFSNTQVQPADLFNTQVQPVDLSSTQEPSADLSNTQVASSSTMPELLYITMAQTEPNTELLHTQATHSETSAPTFNNHSSETELEQATASSLDAEDASAVGSASENPLKNDTFTGDTLTTATAATGLSPETTLSNDTYDVGVENETTVFPFTGNATDYKNDTNVTSTDDSELLGNLMMSLMPQSPDANTMKQATNMDTSDTPDFSSSSMSSFPSSKFTMSFTPPTPLPPPQPQEMTLTAKAALGFGVIVGMSFVIVVATVSVQQCLGYWARKDYSNLDQDNITFS